MPLDGLNLTGERCRMKGRCIPFSDIEIMALIQMVLDKIGAILKVLDCYHISSKRCLSEVLMRSGANILHIAPSAIPLGFRDLDRLTSEDGGWLFFLTTALPPTFLAPSWIKFASSR